MKKGCSILLLILCCVFPSGCGERNTQQNRVMEYSDVQAESEMNFQREGRMDRATGTQFYQGEAVQICPDRMDGTVDVYLYREDNSRELLVEGLAEDYYFGYWFLDGEGTPYYWSTGMVEGIEKLDASGKVACSIPVKDMGVQRIVDMCQLADGRLFITYLEGGMGSAYTLAEVNPATGKASKVSTVKLDGMGRVAAGEEGLLYMDERGVYAIDMEDGSKASILSFIGTSYLLQDTQSIDDFRVLEDGSVEILRYDKISHSGSREVLKASDKTTDKAILTFRCYDFSSGGSMETWLKNRIDLFNKQSTDYLILLDESLEGMEREDFSRQTSIEMTAGKGPDIIFGDVLGDYVYGAIQKGALVDLAPYMEQSGIREEDYFPAAFDCWRAGDGIYGVCIEVSMTDYRINSEVLGGQEHPDVEVLADALLAWPENAVFRRGYDSREVLKYFLQGSEDLWGMVDWNGGTCDFSGGLFAKILETAKRYGDDDGKDYPELVEMRVIDVMGFDTAADRKAEGMTAIGMPFDDGGHGVIRSSWQGFRNQMLAVNANSAYVEGAWAFISYLLGEEVQVSFQSNSNGANVRIPVNKKAFEICTQKRVDWYVEREEEQYAWLRFDQSSGEYIGMYKRSYQDLTEEKLTEFRESIEGARPIPIRTAPILDVIYEEAEYYFNGAKSIEEVSAVIQNRVQLYMDENY